MKKMIIAMAAAGLVSFGASAFAGDAEAGKALFNSSSCAGCHGANGEGGVGPKLAGKSADFVKKALHEYKAGKQRGPMTSMMAPMAAGLSDSDIDNIAAFIATLK